MYIRGNVHSPHALLEVAVENDPDFKPVNIFGFNRALDTTSGENELSIFVEALLMRMKEE
jgi:hypothetical protein